MCSDWASGQSSASLEPEKRCTGLKIGPMLSLFLKQDSCPWRSESVDTLMGFALSRAPVKMPFLEKAPKICQQVMLILLSLSSWKEPLDVLNNWNKIRLVYCFCLRTDGRARLSTGVGGGWGGLWKGEECLKAAVQQWRDNEEGRHQEAQRSSGHDGHPTWVLLSPPGIPPLSSPILWPQLRKESEAELEVFFTNVPLT